MFYVAVNVKRERLLFYRKEELCRKTGVILFEGKS
jgi:hypothetical protein